MGNAVIVFARCVCAQIAGSGQKAVDFHRRSIRKAPEGPNGVLIILYDFNSYGSQMR